jgi:hypothetical protein
MPQALLVQLSDNLCVPLRFRKKNLTTKYNKGKNKVTQRNNRREYTFLIVSLLIHFSLKKCGVYL